jgi:hypothetical protein
VLLVEELYSRAGFRSRHDTYHERIILRRFELYYSY